MYKIARLFKNRIFVIFIIVLFLSGALFPMVGSTEEEAPVSQSSSRGARGVDMIIEGNQIQTVSTSVTYSSVWVKDNGKFTIKAGGKVKIEGRLNVTDNGEVIIEGILNVWNVFANCKTFTIEKGIINCKSGEISSKDGYSSIVRIHTQEPIEITKGKINCEGQQGSSSDAESRAGYDGGNGEIELLSNSSIKITSESEIISTGGNGGTGYGGGKVDKGGVGGDGILTLEANGTGTQESILIEDSIVKACGGLGGIASPKDVTSGDGGNGGNALIYIISNSKNTKDKILISKSEIETKQGQGGSSIGIGAPGEPGREYTISFKCQSLIVDEYKTDGDNDELDWFNPGSSIICDVVTSYRPSIRIEAPNDAFLYVPEFGGYNEKWPEARGASTTIYIYNTLSVTVKDNNGNTLEGATVTAKLNSITESGTSDANGLIILLLLGRIITPTTTDSRQYWEVTPSILGASDTYTGVTAPEKHNYITVIVTLVTVEITALEFGGERYTGKDLVDEMVVYGIVTVDGEAHGPNPITSVEVWSKSSTKQIEIGVAIDKATSGKPAYDTWSIDWNTGSSTFGYLEGNIITLEAVATDGKFSDTDYINVTIAESPLAPLVNISTPETNIGFKDTITSQTLKIEGTAKDENWDSGLLEHSKIVDKVKINIKDTSGVSVLNTQLTLGSGLKEDKKNNSYTWKFDWNTRKEKIGGGFEYPNGEYTLEVVAIDNTDPTPLESIIDIRKIDLRHILIPTAKINDIIPKKNAKKIEKIGDDGYDYREDDKAGIFYFRTDKGKDEVLLEVDLSGSYDPDKTTLEYYVDFGDVKGLETHDNSMIEHNYFYSTDKKEKKSYRLTVYVRDEDLAQSEKLVDRNNQEIINLTVVIEFIPEDPPFKTPLGELVPLPLARNEIRIMFIIIIIVFNIAAGIIITNKYKKINKRRQAREAALTASRQKQKEEAEKKKKDIYAHLEFVDDTTKAQAGQVAVAGAVGAMELPTEEALALATAQSAEPSEPEAPQLISVEQPIFESGIKEDARILPAPAPVTPVPATQAPAPTPPPPPAQTETAPTTQPTTQPMATAQQAPQTTTAPPQPAQPVSAQPVQQQQQVQQQSQEDEEQT